MKSLEEKFKELRASGDYNHIYANDIQTALWRVDRANENPTEAVAALALLASVAAVIVGIGVFALSLVYVLYLTFEVRSIVLGVVALIFMALGAAIAAVGLITSEHTWDTFEESFLDRRYRS